MITVALFALESTALFDEHPTIEAMVSVVHEKCSCLLYKHKLNTVKNKGIIYAHRKHRGSLIITDVHV